MFLVPAKKNPEDERRFSVGDRVQVTLSSGRIVPATIKAISHYKHGPKFQVDYGKDETALVFQWQVRRE